MQHCHVAEFEHFRAPQCAEMENAATETLHEKRIETK